MMEDDKKSPELQENSLQNNDKEIRSAPSAEDIIDEMIQKASLERGSSSDEEYISAEEEDDVENDEVIKCGDETESADVLGGTAEHLDGSERDEETEENEEAQKIADELEERKKEEESLTEEERMDRRTEGQKYKDDGNIVFRNGNYDEAIMEYTRALDICPLNFHKERAIMYANRAACKMKKDSFEEAIKDSTHAIELHPQYVKAILRRAELYEKTEKLDEALKDYETVVGLDPDQHMARAACMRLQEQIKDRNEKMKTEMMGKLKDLGNLVLRPFGLSTNNFKLQQDPSTGSYSVQFQQNPTGNGS